MHGNKSCTIKIGRLTWSRSYCENMSGPTTANFVDFLSGTSLHHYSFVKSRREKSMRLEATPCTFWKKGKNRAHQHWWTCSPSGWHFGILGECQDQELFVRQVLQPASHQPWRFSGSVGQLGKPRVLLRLAFWAHHGFWITSVNPYGQGAWSVALLQLGFAWAPPRGPPVNFHFF